MAKTERAPKPSPTPPLVPRNGTPWTAEIRRATSGFGYDISASGHGMELRGGSWALTLRGARRRARRICRWGELREQRATTVLEVI